VAASDTIGTMSAAPVRLGLIAASRIADLAVVDPLREPGVEGVELAAVAARDLTRAEAAAARCGAALSFGSYAELLASDAVDAVYIGTPAALHRPWAIAAIEAGKHALVEKPFASNAADAQLIADAAAAHPDVVVMEAFHWRYHPFADRVAELIRSGAIGRVERAEGVFDIPIGQIPLGDIRWDLPLGGGATMDLGCYSIQWVRHAIAACPESGGDVTMLPEVVSAVAVESAGGEAPGVDGSLGAELRWPSGATGSIHSSMIADGDAVVATLVVHGTHGTLTVVNPLAPQNPPAELRLHTADGDVVEAADPSTTYWHQMVAFRDAIVEGAAFPTTAADGVRNMQVIDACYAAAGLTPRPAFI
jgi:predicted dehydrogenase